MQAKETQLLCAVDVAHGGRIGVDDLEQALRKIQGTKVIVLDCCYSGGFVYPREEERTKESFFQDMPQECLADQFKDVTGGRFSCHQAPNCYLIICLVYMNKSPSF